MERQLLEQTTTTTTSSTLKHKIYILLLKLYDSACPKLIQNIIYKPYWNKRTSKDLITLITKKRVHDLWEYNKYKFHFDYGTSGACIGIGQSLYRPFIKDDENNSNSKILLLFNQIMKFTLAIGVSIFSFMICSPWFIINLWIVFYCSISLV